MAGLVSDLREAQQHMAMQTAEMRNLGNVTDEMIEQVGELTDAFHQIDAERTSENLVHQNVVNSVLVHVQDTHHHVNELARHVQSVSTPNVMHLVSQDTGNRQEAAPQEDDVRWLGVDGYGLGGRPAAAPNAASMSYSADPRQSHNPRVATSSQYAMQSDKMNRPPTVHHEPQSARRVVVGNPPQLPSRTQRTIECIVQAHMERMGAHARPHEANVRGEAAVTSTARNVYNPGPGSTQFSFPRIGGNVASTSGQQIFATAQWRPKAPPAFMGNASGDVYLWTSLVRQYFVFMSGTARQEVAFEATLLRGAAHEWYMGYEQRNGNQPSQDWPTMQQAISDRFGSNIRAQEAHAKFLTISQGKRSVRDYTSEFETFLGRLSTRDETTWKNMYIWGLQPHVAEVVALKYPTTIAQAAGHAEQIELAKKTSQRPILGNFGSTCHWKFQWTRRIPGWTSSICSRTRPRKRWSEPTWRTRHWRTPWWRMEPRASRRNHHDADQVWYTAFSL